MPNLSCLLDIASKYWSHTERFFLDFRISGQFPLIIKIIITQKQTMILK